MTTFILWTCTIGLLVGGAFGLVVFFHIEGVKGFLCGLLTTIIIALFVGGLFTLDTMGKEETWNEGKCPECNVEWTPFGVSQSRHGAKTKYYYCEECHTEIQI